MLDEEAKDEGKVYGDALKVLVYTPGVRDDTIVARDEGSMYGDAENVFVMIAGVREVVSGS